MYTLFMGREDMCSSRWQIVVLPAPSGPITATVNIWLYPKAPRAHRYKAALGFEHIS
jgi:hypothetical protein